MGKTRSRRGKVFDTPERRKNGRSKRRVLLDRAADGKDWRGQLGEIKT